MSTSTLEKILEESRKLAYRDGTSSIPPVERNFDSLNYESKKLAINSNRAFGPKEDKIQAFLLEGGVDVRELRDKSNATFFQPLQSQIEPEYTTDVDSYIISQYESCLTNGIDECQGLAIEDFDNSMNFTLNQAWEETKKAVFDDIGQPSYLALQYKTFDENPNLSKADLPQFNRRSTADYVEKSSFSIKSRISQSKPRVEAYIKVIRNLNSSRLNNVPFDLAEESFKASDQTTKLTGDKQISDCWKLIETISRNNLPLLQEKIDFLGSESSAEKRQELINSSRQYLENSYLSYIDRVVEQNVREAAVGGIPSIHSKIRGFLQVKFGKSSSVPEFLEVYDNEAIWAHMYYLLRSGKLKDLLTYALGLEDVLSDSDPNFIGCLNNYIDSPNRTLDIYNQERISASVGMMRINLRMVDPYKYAIYKVVGRCDLSKKTVSEVVQTTEDYLWHQLVMIREVEEKTSYASGLSKYTLSDLQNLLNRFGQKHFDPSGSNPLLYFSVLMISLQFEQAIEFLLQHELYFADAVHFAIALAYYGFLNIVDFGSMTSGLSYVVFLEFQPLIDFNRLIIDFSRSLPEQMMLDSIHYLFLLNLPTLFTKQKSDIENISQQKQLCEDLIVRRLYEFRDYSPALGDVLKDGTKQDGFIDKYSDLLGFGSGQKGVISITKKLADKSKEDGRLSDAVMLYNLAGNYNTVLTALAKQLGNDLFQIIHGKVGINNQKNNLKMSSEYNNPLSNNYDIGETQDILILVLEHYENHENIASKLDQKRVKTCQTLLILLDFADKYITNSYEDALAIIVKTNMFPINSLVNSYLNNLISQPNDLESNSVDTLKAANIAETLRDYDDSIQKSFPDILLATMDTISKLYNGYKSSPFTEQSGDSEYSSNTSYSMINKKSSLSLLRKMSKNLVVFAGMCQFRMPPDIFAKLNRADTLMN
ncbi:hypothetical protein BB561_002029 [Smittium simulii]|uniref:Nuclear pore protein n=1 Tax=Smittium simulii TaxID=133385 RepID=A0A2T9YRY8_9FUNG|nr:hypothetical protein BB561_002029 [Smittium simulii]